MLSGGQRARIALARALVKVNFDLLLLISLTLMVQACSVAYFLSKLSFDFFHVSFSLPTTTILFLFLFTLQDPAVLLLDEPTAALDSDSEQSVISALSRYDAH